MCIRDSACLAMKEFNNAEKSLQYAISLKPDSLQIQYSLGLVLIKCGKNESACASFHETVRIKPDFAEGHYMLGQIYLETFFEVKKGVNHLSKAEKLFTKLEDFDRLARVRALLGNKSNDLFL